ncbi:hypothetical protein ECZU25_14400 [Escherichia coli]|nr:hypothetical protein ECZU25_14400 [Escherichia coli]
MLAQTGAAPRSAVFSFSRQMQGTGEIVTALLAALLDGENMDVMLRGVWLTSSLQRGQVDDIFTQSAARQYGLGNSSLATGLWWRRRRILLAASSLKSCWLSRTGG